MRPLDDLLADWPALEPLLDEALAMPPEVREAWLQGLRDVPPHRVEALRRLLLGPQGQAPLPETLPHLPGQGSGDLPSAASTQSMHELSPGDDVGPWRLIRPLGDGGMGTVWLAERSDGLLRRAVALKLPRLHWSTGLLRRFAAERDLLAALEHPGIARLYDAGVDAKGWPWLALEYVQGQPIDVYCRQQQLGLRDRIGLLLRACEAMAHAHSRLIVHRDLKPQHILVTDEGEVRLLDFGIGGLLHQDAQAGWTHQGGIGLTPGYASPEQLRGERPGTTTDVFSLGCIAYEVLSGTSAFRYTPGSVRAYERALLEQEPLPASRAASDRVIGRLLRGDLDAVLAQSLQIDPTRRYQQVQSMADDLRAWLDGQPVRARRLGRGELLLRWARRHRPTALAGALIAVTLVGSAVFSERQAQVARTEAARAAQQAELARRQARSAQAAQQLLHDIFRLNSLDQPDPRSAQKTTVREVLDLAVRSAPDKLREAPEVHLGLLETLNSLYGQLGAFGPATQAARDRVALARRTLAADDPHLADALLSLSARLHDTPERAQARAMVDEAERIIQQAGEAGRSLEGFLWMQRARHERWGKVALAVEQGERAVAWFREHQPQDGLRVSALYFGSVLQALAGNPDRALDHLAETKLMADAKINGGGRALLTATAERGDLLVDRGLLREADAAFDEAIVVGERLQGPLHPSTLVMRIHRARWWVHSGRARQGDAEWARIQSQIAARQPPLESWWIDYARNLFEARNTERGGSPRMAAAARAAVKRARETIPDSVVMADRLLRLAQSLSAEGLLDEAQQELQAAQAIERRARAGLPRVGLDLPWQLERARLLLMQGHCSEAAGLLQSLPGSPGLAPGAVDRQGVRRQVLLARAWGQQQQPARALAEADAALAALSRLPAPFRFHHEEAEAQVERARALGALGQVAAARTALEAAIRLRAAHDLPDSKLLATLRAQARRPLPWPARGACTGKSL